MRMLFKIIISRVRTITFEDIYIEILTEFPDAIGGKPSNGDTGILSTSSK